MPGNRERRRPGQFRICVKCGKRNKSRRLECSRCHEPLRGLPEATPGKLHAPPPPSRQYRWWVLAVLLIAAGAGFFVHQTFNTNTGASAAAVPSEAPTDTSPPAPASRPTFDPTSAERYAQAKGSVDRGQRLLVRGDFRGAASLLADAARLVPEDPRIANSYGQALRGLGSRDRALYQFERAARLDTGVAVYRLDYAQALAAAGRKGEAAREYEAVNLLEPGNVAASEGLLRIQQSQPAAAGTGVDMGGAASGGASAPSTGVFTNDDLSRGVRPMRPPSSFPSPRAPSPSPRPPSPLPSPVTSPYTGPFSSPAPF